MLCNWFVNSYCPRGGTNTILHHSDIVYTVVLCNSFHRVIWKVKRCIVWANKGTFWLLYKEKSYQRPNSVSCSAITYEKVYTFGMVYILQKFKELKKSIEIKAGELEKNSKINHINFLVHEFHIVFLFFKSVFSQNMYLIYLHTYNNHSRRNSLRSFIFIIFIV